MDITKTITHLSLCSGYEGIGLGLRELFPTLREIAYVEREAFCAANLVAKMEEGLLDAAPVYTDVKTFPYNQFRGCVDILSGGFPCQPFSVAGAQKGVDDPRHLFPSIASGILKCQPGIVFLENVEGIISKKTHAGESVLRYVLRTLESMGYISTAGLFTASEAGAPHQRKRVFILGYAEHLRPLGSEVARSLTTAVSDLPQGENPTSQPSGAGAPGELAHSDHTDVQGRVSGRTDTERQGVDGHAGRSGASLQQRWVARPHEQQHEWEEPRVKPCVGRTANGYSERVDQLRLLGNGVVPQTAAIAFTTLLNRVI